MYGRKGAGTNAQRDKWPAYSQCEQCAKAEHCVYTQKRDIGEMSERPRAKEHGTAQKCHPYQKERANPILQIFKSK
ncbi:hypothetical protein GCM10025857_27720 [Alicyclobacillus contaminans]|nr:hypothetical protein GCM10025857_27720 [Alicyclobacillus contaminans]